MNIARRTRHLHRCIWETHVADSQYQTFTIRAEFCASLLGKAIAHKLVEKSFLQLQSGIYLGQNILLIPLAI